MKSKKIDGMKSAVEMLQVLDEAHRRKLLREIAEKDPKTAAELEKGLFIFDDLQYLAATDFQFIWKEFDKKLWLMALRQATKPLLEFISTHISRRAMDQLAEDLRSLGPQPRSKVHGAQQEILKKIRKLSEEGRMSLPNKSSDDKTVI